MSGISIYSQDVSDSGSRAWLRFLHVEAGSFYPDGKIKERISIRQNVSSNYVDLASYGNISSTSSAPIIGIRWEYYNKKVNLGVSTGLRFTLYSNEITGSSSTKADFFYLRYSEMASETRFARVKSLTENKDFLSVPLEIRYDLPIHTKGFGCFIKCGIEASVLSFGEKLNIDFQENAMDSSNDIVMNSLVLNTDRFYSIFYGSTGCYVGKSGKPNFAVEIFFPSKILGQKNFNLVDIKSLEGFKFSVLLPL